MSCNQTTPPCDCVDYQSTGCLDTYNTDCVKYTGDAIECLAIASGDTLTDILDHLSDVVCGLSPASYADFDFGCLSTELGGTPTEEGFVELTSSILCEIIGSQSIGSLTSLSTLVTNYTTLSSAVNTVSTQTTLDCYEDISGISGPTVNISTLLASIQQILCTHEDAIDGLVSSGSVSLTVNDSPSIDFSASGTANHTLTGVVKISSDANNAISTHSDGIYAESVPLTVTDSQTINFTNSGTIGHELTGIVKVSAESDNQITVKSDGIYAPPFELGVADTSTINFSVIGVNSNTITGSVIVDPDAGNALSVTGSGLYVNPSGFSLSNNAVTDSILRDSVAYSVVGRTSGTAGDPTDIQANADQVLRRSGTGNLAFGTLVTNNIGDDQVTFAKTQNINSASVLGRTTAGTGDIEILSAGSHITLTGGTINTVGRTLIGVTKFTTSGTWTKPSGCNAAIVEILGAGGAGGGVLDVDTSEAAAGGGGGAGGYQKLFITSGLGSTESVTIGAGGAGSAGADGGTGGSSSFGSHATSGGGSGGPFMAGGTTIASTGTGGNGGTNTAAVIGNVLVSIPGNYGHPGIRLSATDAVIGLGGGSSFGGSDAVVPAANNSGAGGSGYMLAAPISNDFTVAGNTGGSGLVIVYEYS